MIRLREFLRERTFHVKQDLETCIQEIRRISSECAAAVEQGEQIERRVEEIRREIALAESTLRRIRRAMERLALREGTLRKKVAEATNVAQECLIAGKSRKSVWFSLHTSAINLLKRKNA